MNSATKEHEWEGKKLIKIFNKGRTHYQYASFVDVFFLPFSTGSYSRYVVVHVNMCSFAFRGTHRGIGANLGRK